MRLRLIGGIALLWAGGVLAVDPLDDPLASYDSTRRLPPLHHAVGMSLPDDWPAPKHLPLGPDRSVRCQTCHGIRDMERVPYRQIDRKAAHFLRGGPYPELQTFCFACHDREALERPNIHLMLDDAGQPREDHCTYCHEEVPQERERPHRAVEDRLRLPPEKLCYGCHLKTPHFNALEHQAAKPDAAMRRQIRASEQRLGVRLPLSAEGQVMCASCHSPHQYGVINAAKNPAGQSLHPVDLKRGVEYREHPWNRVVQADKRERLADLNQALNTRFTLDYQRVDQEVLLRLPARDGTLCLACHVFRD